MTTLEKVYMELQQCEGGESPSNAAFDLVRQLVEEFGEQGIADRVLDQTPLSTSWQLTADILAIMIWSTSDNGAQISRDSERWINECSDERRAFVALNLDVYPYLDSSEMEASLRKLAVGFPALSDVCDSMIAS